MGTSTLLDSHEHPSDVFEMVARSVVALRTTHRIVLITSGAIGFGVTRMQLDHRPQRLGQLQALSMIGQVGLMRRWREAFEPIVIGQVLVTQLDLSRTIPSMAFNESVTSLWDYGAIPLVNENDAVSTAEISFGDNDQLAAEIAVCLSAETLVLLTDQDGIQQEFGSDQQRRIEVVAVEEAKKHISQEHVAVSSHGRGGALSKLLAADIALSAGTDVYIACARQVAAVERAMAGQVGTKLVQ